jgi:Ca-activated chloride channel family protein
MIYWLQHIHFKEPWFLLLLSLIPVFLYLKYKKMRGFELFFPLPTLKGIGKITSWKLRFYKMLPVLRMISYALIVFALARPQLSLKEEQVKAEGIDIMMVLDVSLSMLAKDFEPDRLQAAKRVAIEFVDKRPHDRIGLTVFSGEAFTVCPLTTDREVLNNFIEDLKPGILEDGTALGNGLSSAVNRLKDAKAKSKVAILLTDGVNNRGFVEPVVATELAKEMDVKVYSIGVGTEGMALFPIARHPDGGFFYDYVRVEIDEALLRNMADATGGRYFRAQNEDELNLIYNEIDQLEKTEVEVRVFKRYSEEFGFFVFWALALLVLEMILRNSWLKTTP